MFKFKLSNAVNHVRLFKIQTSVFLDHLFKLNNPPVWYDLIFQLFRFLRLWLYPIKRNINILDCGAWWWIYFGCWWVVVDGDWYILACGEQWWLVVNIFWLVEGSGGFILAVGGWWWVLVDGGGDGGWWMVVGVFWLVVGSEGWS